MLGSLENRNRAKFRGCMTVLGLLGSGRGGGGSLECGCAPTLPQMVTLVLSILPRVDTKRVA